MSACANPTPTGILVVDDDEDVLKMTSFVLKRLGYPVSTMNDGSAALESLEKTKFVPCLILLDLMMPKMNGAAFRKKLLGMPGVAGVPVVILSGDTDLASKATEMKVAGFEQKPISVERLATLAAKYCPRTA